MRISLPLILVLVFGLLGCTPIDPPLTPDPTMTSTVQEPTQAATAAPPPTVSPTLEPSLYPVEVCSPLAGFRMDQLVDLIVNPYNPPKLGSDDPHQGVDLAVLSAPGGIALSGNIVQAVLSGKVASKTIDRFPYGNSLMVETPLNEPETDWFPLFIFPTPLPQRLPSGALSCPVNNQPPARPDEPRSLYILYAHMLNPSILEPGETIQCGQEIGVIGDSGNALNPHLHVEARIGPAGESFNSMAHYDPSADEAEMGAYCTWRVSGVFQTINPGCLWEGCQ